MDWDDFKHLLTIIIIILFIAIFLFFIFGSAYLADKKICKEKAILMDVPYHYGFWTDCMIKIDGKLRPLKYYRIVE